MKRFLILGFILSICMAGMAQTGTGNMTATNGLTLDTVSNTGNKSLYIGTTGKAKFDGSASFVLTITKISGTVGGTATLEGSHNGTDWGGIATAYTITDGTQTKTFDFDRSKYSYYRIKVVGTGTMSASIKGTYLTKVLPTN